MFWCYRGRKKSISFVQSHFYHSLIDSAKTSDKIKDTYDGWKMWRNFWKGFLWHSSFIEKFDKVIKFFCVTANDVSWYHDRNSWYYRLRFHRSRMDYALRRECSIKETSKDIFPYCSLMLWYNSKRHCSYCKYERAKRAQHFCEIVITAVQYM